MAPPTWPEAGSDQRVVLLDHTQAGMWLDDSVVDADAHGVDVEAAIPEGMRAKAAEFEARGGEIYLAP